MDDFVFVIKTNDGMGMRYLSGVGDGWCGFEFQSWKAMHFETFDEAVEKCDLFRDQYCDGTGVRAWVDAMSRGDT